MTNFRILGRFSFGWMMFTSCALPSFQKIEAQDGGGGDSAGGVSSGQSESTPSGRGGTSSLNGGANSSAIVQGGTFGTGSSSGGSSTQSSGGTTSDGGSSAVITTPDYTKFESCLNLSAQCSGASCCMTIAIASQTFPMGRSTVAGEADYYPNGSNVEIPEHEARLSPYALDKFEVTVGRFRAFIAAYDTWHGEEKNPKDNAGAHSVAANTGWARSNTLDVIALPDDAFSFKNGLKCDPLATWTDEAGTHEEYPINCVNWHEAFAFCIWDGGRLPTEAEWECAAVGGRENRLFPWGQALPDATRANYSQSDNSPRVAVGSKGSSGEGFFGHLDLAGSMWEWVFDWYTDDYYGTSTSPIPCADCASVKPSSSRIRRGGEFAGGVQTLRGTYRGIAAPASRSSGSGFRCARNL